MFKILISLAILHLSSSITLNESQQCVQELCQTQRSDYQECFVTYTNRNNAECRTDNSKLLEISRENKDCVSENTKIKEGGINGSSSVEWSGCIVAMAAGCKSDFCVDLYQCLQDCVEGTLKANGTILGFSLGLIIILMSQL